MQIDYVRVYQSEITRVNLGADNQQFFDLKNVPNPAHNYTIISYNLPESTEVELSIHDLNGRLIQILVDEWQTKGQHCVKWNIDNLLSGMFFCTLQNLMTNLH